VKLGAFLNSTLEEIRLFGPKIRSGRTEEARSLFLLLGIITPLLGCVGFCVLAIPTFRKSLFNYECKKYQVSSAIQQQATVNCLSTNDCHLCSFKVTRHSIDMT
jgi:hypothetical protein